MQLKRARKDVRVLNKVTGEILVITNVEGKGENKVATAVPESEAAFNELNKVMGRSQVLDKIMEDAQVSFQKTPTSEVTINSNNALAFRFISDPNPADVPENIKILDNNLYVEDNKIEMGDIRAEKILGTLPGYILFTAKSSKGDLDYLNIYSYNPGRDVFRSLYTNIPVTATIKKIRSDEQYFWFVINDKTDQQLETTEGNVETYEVYNISTLVRLTGSICEEISVNGPLPEDLSDYTFLDDKNIAVMYVGGVFTTVYDVDGNEYSVVDKTRTLERCFYIYIPEFEVDDEIACSKPIIVSAGSMAAPVLITKDSIVLHGKVIDNIPSDVIRAVVDHPIFVDETVTGSVTRLSFVSKEYELITVLINKTKDRGTIYSLA